MSNRSPLELDLLRSFLAVEQTGSFSRAAEVLGRSQPAISLQIKRLEARAGVALFDRSRSGEVRLTPAGATLMRYAHEILALHDEAVATLAAPAHEKPHTARHSRRTRTYEVTAGFAGL